MKLILRNLFKNRSYTILNVIGLAIGFACSFSVIVWVQNELSYDKHLPDADRTYRLTFETNTSGNRLHFARCWEKWVWQMPGVFPQIEEMVRLAPYRHTAIKVGENKLYSDRVFATDSNFFKVFGIGLLSGDAEKVLKEPYSAVISSNLAHKLFGNKDPIGQILLMSGEQYTKMEPFTIKGIMMDSPSNSHIHFDILTSFVKPLEAPSWAYVYLLLKKNTNPDDILSGMPAFIKDVEKNHEQTTFKPYLQKITDIHLFSNKDREVEPNGNISTIYLFIAIALVLLFVSWVNYYNLNKARLLVLQKQIDIQRITGADNRLIITQSAAESGISVSLSLILAGILLYLSGNLYNSLFGLILLPDGYKDFINACPFVLVILIISLLAGSLPVILSVLTGQNSLTGFKENRNKVKADISSYRILMTGQFFLSIILIVAAITINQQKELMLSRSLGNMSSDILVLKKLNWEIRYKYTAFREKALQNPLIKSVTACSDEPSSETADVLQVESPAIDESHKDNSLYILSVEDNFLDFFGIPLVAGSYFSQYNPNRRGEDYILNETAVKRLGWTPEEAIGKPFKIKFDVPDIFYGGTVVGVVRDFNFTTLKQEIKPYAFFQKPIWYYTFIIQIDSASKEETIMSLKNIWEQELPDYPFQYEFISNMYRTSYKKELTQAKLTTFFSILAIVIICFGLFSITSVLVARRTKEIGIRKVNGAKLINIMTLLNTGFIKWVAIAFVIACPVAWYLMNRWLQSFVYKTGLYWWIFVAAGAVVLAVVLFTVSLQSWLAAKKNPVESLRYE